MFCKNRGPDKTVIENINNFFFVHNLLDITGDIIEQF